MRILSGGINRVWLLIIGLVLLILSTGWLLSAMNILTTISPRLNPASTPLSGAEGLMNQSWMPAVMIIAAAVLILWGLSWLVRQVPRKHQAPTLQFHDDARQGVTLMDSSALSDAIAHDVEDLEHVTSARALLRGNRQEPQLILQVTINERADAQAVVAAISETVLPRAAQALETSLSQAGVEITVTRQNRKKDRVRVQ